MVFNVGFVGLVYYITHIYIDICVYIKQIVRLHTQIRVYDRPRGFSIIKLQFSDHVTVN